MHVKINTDNTGEIYELGRLTHEQARLRIQSRPAVIIPLGSCEPFGQIGAVGAGTVCATEVAKDLSAKCKVLAAPPIPFGCSTPFISFPGATGVKPRTFINMLCEIIHAYVFQGVVRVFLINAAPFNREPAAEAIKRVEGKYPAVKAMLYDINAVIKGRGAVAGFDRDDELILSLLAYIRPDMHHGVIDDKRKNIDAGQYRTWKKRGRDPEKLRKLSSGGLFLPADDGASGIAPKQGEKYFCRVVESIQKEMQAALESIPPSPDSGGARAR
ncbi:MAG: creatininase family protein [Chitinispirillales bacterium]|jgi:creatinine amidohydrolase/Fe(II)-dependent formamide hydrolase-like protein|nr:creatininase family protein [Chitinispirillales bacterium]